MNTAQRKLLIQELNNDISALEKLDSHIERVVSKDGFINWIQLYRPTFCIDLNRESIKESVLRLPIDPSMQLIAEYHKTLAEELIRRWRK